MNPTIDLLLNRRSVRAYCDQPVTRVEKDTILQAAMRAPTAGNMMLYSILEIEDQALKDRLAETCDHQPFIARAPFVLIFMADYQRWFDYFRAGGVEELCRQRGLEFRRPQEGDLLLACTDAVIAAHTAVTAADALGIGSCYIGDIIEHYELNREMFHLPKYVAPIAMICFGYPTSEQAARKQTPRFEREFIVHQNTYQQVDPEGLERMFAERNGRFLATGKRKDELENVGQATYLRKFSAEFTYEMTRSARALLEHWTKE